MQGAVTVATNEQTVGLMRRCHTSNLTQNTQHAQHTPMEVDNSRGQRFKARPRYNQVNRSLESQVRCWRCGQTGHIGQDCKAEDVRRPPRGHGRPRPTYKKTGKLGCSLHTEVGMKSSENGIKEKFTQENFDINVSGSPNSCLVKIGKQKFRTLVDTGAECRVYDQLKNKARLVNKKV